jgi:serine/threonine protein kinase
LLPTLKQLFNREVAALKKLGNYPQVPQLLAHFEENQEFYLVQEFIAGSPLSDELKPGQQWSESQVIDLLQEVLGILSLIHSYGLIHRDVKPNNLIRRQKDRRLVLIDFGSVKQAWMQVVTVQGKTSASYAIGIPATLAIGTSGYMPTEQGRGRPRPNSDIYALGIIGIQALTGLSPTELLEDFNTAEVIWQHKAQVSADLASVLNKMVCYDFKDRYQSATEVLQALQPLINTAVPQHSAMTQLSEIEIQPKSSADAVVVRDRVRQHLPKNISNAAVLRS